MSLRRLGAFLVGCAIAFPQLASAAVFTTTVSWNGGPCTVCGGSYACSNNAGNWNGGNQTFNDPTGGSGEVVSVTVVANMENCSGGLNTASLDGTVVGTWSGPASCACGGCDAPASMTLSTPNGFPGYVYGGVNTLNISAAILVCMASATITITTAPVQIAVAPAAIAFGNQRVATTSAAQTVTITNPGTAGLKVTAIAVGGANPGDFSLAGVPALPLTVAPNSSATFQAKFTPTTVGARAATIAITNNSNNAPNSTVVLTGNGIQPTVAVAPASLAFGNQRVATTSATQTLTISNTGTDNLKVSGIALGGGNPGDFALVGLPALPATVAPNGSASFQVNFTPTAAGARAATVTISSDAANAPSVIVPITGNGIQPAIAVAPNALAFGNQRVATTSAPQTLTITNTGTDNLKVSAIALGGANAGDFALAGLPALPATIGPNGSATFQVNFTPTAVGARAAVVTISSDAGNAPSLLVPITGNGIQPAIGVAPPSLAFGNQRVATTSAAQVVTITNIGSDTMHVTGIALGGANPGDFGLVGVPALPVSIVPNGTTAFQVNFAPTVAGARSAAVTITSDAGNAPTVTVPLTGTGIQPSVTVAPNALSFGNQRVATTSAPQSVTVTNSGTDDLHVSAIALGGANGGDFALVNLPVLPATIAANGSASFQVTFTPTAAGARSGTVTITSDAANTPSAVVTLTGTGIQPNIALAPGAVSFGSQRVATTSTSQTVTITNSGTDNLKVTAIALSGSNPGDFALAGLPVLPVSLAPNASTTLQVTFTPTAVGARSAAIAIASDAANTPNATVPLDGTGIQQSVAIAPLDVKFADQRVATTSASSTVTVSNIGTDTLTFNDVFLNGANAADFALVNLPNLPVTVAPGNNVTFGVTFTPSVVGARAASAMVQTDDPNQPSVQVTLEGNGISPLVALMPMAIDFGAVPIGTTPTQNLLVNNTGNDVLTIQMLQLTGSGNFAEVNPPMLPSTIAPGGSLTLVLSYTPTAVAVDNGKLTLVTDNPNMPNFEVPITGTGVSGSIVVAPMALDFGGVVVSKTSPTQDITVKNGGQASFSLTGATVIGADAIAFKLPNPPVLPFLLAPGASTLVHVAYAPTVHAPQTAAVHFTTDLPNGTSADVALTGMGLEAGIGASPAALDFGTVVVGNSGGPLALTLRNTGDAPLDLGVPTISGTNAAAFSVQLTPPGPIAPGAMVVAQVTFTPPSTGSFSAVLNATSTDANVAPVAVPLTGIGADAALDVTPLALNFGTISIGATGGPLTVTIHNPGTELVTLAAITSSAGDFMVVPAGPLPAMLPAGATFKFEVLFAPTTTGAQSATIAIDTALKKGAATVMAQGTGKASLAGGGCACGLATGTRSPGAPLTVAVVALIVALFLRRRR